MGHLPVVDPLLREVGDDIDGTAATGAAQGAKAEGGASPAHEEEVQEVLGSRAEIA